MLPIVLVLLDGLGDRAHAALGGRTATEAAATPNLDRFASRGSCGVLYGVGPGRAPSSEVAHWAMLGYRVDEFPGRAVFEAYGRGLEVAEGAVYAYAALRPAELRDGELWLTGRPDPVEDAGDAEELVRACDGIEIDGLMFALTHVWRGEAVLRIDGDADERVTDSDAFFRDRHPVLRPHAAAREAERTATAAEQWTHVVIDRLAGHAINARRERDGRAPLNVITLKWWGRARAVPTFLHRHGVTGAFAAESAFLRGLGRAVGLEPVVAGQSADVAADIRARLDLAADRLAGGDTFVYVHHKAIDTAGHTKDPEIKRGAVEQVDSALDGLAELAQHAVVCVTGDHATPASPDVIHSGDPVPIVVAGPGVRADKVGAFGELDCADGILGQLRGADLMPVLLNAADRPLFLGSRPTPFDGADGYPALLEPLRISESGRASA